MAKLRKAMISAAQPEAVEAGAVVLQQGGNAVDAAMACAMVQGVVDPQMCGIAGFGSLQVHLPDRAVHECIDFHGKTPAAATESMWEKLVISETRDGFGFILEGRVNEVGHQSITVPGSLLAYHEAQSEWGTWDWADIVQPAIEQAERGFVVRPHVYNWWTEPGLFDRLETTDRLRHTEDGRRIYFHPDGTLKRPGERVENPDMARTLRRIADGGAEVFYSGEIAEEIVADMKANGGLLSARDLADFRTTRTSPLRGTYRDFEIATNQPPGGGIMVLQMLNTLENFDLASLGHNAAEYLRVVAEAMKLATIDKEARVGDPAFVEVPVEKLCGKAYAAELATRIRLRQKAHVSRLQGPAESKQTTQVSVVDRDGNAVSMTHSLGMPSGVITPGLGFMYNGCMSVFDPRPGRAGSIAPGKSRFSAICPSMVFRDGETRLVIGAPGGTQIVMGVLQAMLNVLEFDMGIVEAIVAPRFSATSDVLEVSNRIPRYVTDVLAGQGYEIGRSHLSYPFAGVHGIRIDDGLPTGFADPNHDGMALGV